MKTFMYTIADPQGLHTCPAGMLVKKSKGISVYHKD